MAPLDRVTSFDISSLQKIPKIDPSDGNEDENYPPHIGDKG